MGTGRAEELVELGWGGQYTSPAQPEWAGQRRGPGGPGHGGGGLDGSAWLLRALSLRP